MKYKIGDKVICEVEVQQDGKRRLLIKDPVKTSKVTKQEFPIIHIDNGTELYTILLDDDMVGWQISQWHVKYWDVAPKYVGKTFYDVPESIFKGKK
jgi:hypothetical protein